MLHMDFTSQDYLRDPATGLSKLRAAGPVVEVRFPIIGRTLVTTTSDLASHVLLTSSPGDLSAMRIRRGPASDDDREAEIEVARCGESKAPPATLELRICK